MRVPLLLALLVVILATADAAYAAEKGLDKQALEKVAKKACITGDFRRGTDILGGLYVETDDPTYIYNQGRCYEQNHHCEEAIDRFREYLRKMPNLTVGEKDDLERHIKDCKAQLAEQSAPQPARAAPSSVGRPPAPPVPAAAPPPAVVAAVVAPPLTATPSGDGSGLRTAGIVVAAAGVGGVVAGVVLALKTQSLTDKLNRPEGYDRGLADTNKTYQAWGWVSYGVGAAALVTGATLYVLGWPSRTTSTDSTRLSLVPTPAPGGTALHLQGTF